MKLLRVSLVAILLAGSCNTWAQQSSSTDHRFYLAPMASYDFFDEDTFKPGDRLGFQLALGKNLNRFFALELNGFYFNGVDLKPGGDLDTFGLGLDLLAFPARQVLPVFAILGGGFGRHNFDNVAADVNHQNSDFYDLGVGLLIPVTANGLAIRGEYRYRRSSVDGPARDNLEFRDNIVSLGLQIPLGQSANKPFPWPPEAQQQPPPAAQPRPLPALRPAPVESAPAPAPTNKDTDNDGVLNHWDKCPNSPVNATVDLDGCTISADAALFVLEGVNFEYDSASLTPAAKGKLRTAVDSLRGSPSLQVRIEGYTDSIGGDAYNLRLSQQRAESVRQFFIQRGIRASRLHAIGLGESHPVAPNNNAQNRARNRRVELHAIRK